MAVTPSSTPSRGWGAPQPVPYDEAVERLARRHLEGHGPATAADLARWAGVPLGTARRGLDAIGAELVTVSDDLVALAAVPPPGDLPEPRLLRMFDPILHGWVSREPFLDTRGSAVISGGSSERRHWSTAAWRRPGLSTATC